MEQKFLFSLHPASPCKIQSKIVTVEGLNFRHWRMRARYQSMRRKSSLWQHRRRLHVHLRRGLRGQWFWMCQYQWMREVGDVMTSWKNYSEEWRHFWCRSNTSLCGAYAQCVDTEGDYVCECEAGFSGHCDKCQGWYLKQTQKRDCFDFRNIHVTLYRHRRMRHANSRLWRHLRYLRQHDWVALVFLSCRVHQVRFVLWRHRRVWCRSSQVQNIVSAGCFQCMLAMFLTQVWRELDVRECDWIVPLRLWRGFCGAAEWKSLQRFVTFTHTASKPFNNIKTLTS